MSKSKWRRLKPLATNQTPPKQASKKVNAKFSLVLYSVFAIAILSMLAVDAYARNLHQSATKIASDKFEAQMHRDKQPAAIDVKNSQIPKQLLALKTPTIVAPRGVDQGNKVIAQGSGASSGGAVYDPMRRIVKIVETTGGSVTSTKQFVWAGDQLCEERDGSGAVTKRFFNGGEQIAGTNYYATRDHLGSVRELTNGAGAIQSQYGYSSWGEVTKLAGSGPDSDMQYAGMYKHARSGLNLAVNRAYSPSQGRFISRDPIDDPAFEMNPKSPEPETPNAMTGPMAPILSVSDDPIVQAQLIKVMSPATNPYMYGHNNPISNTDRSGLGDDDLEIPKKIGKWALCNYRCVQEATAAHSKCMTSIWGNPIICGAVYSAVYVKCMALCMCEGGAPE